MPRQTQAAEEPLEEIRRRFPGEWLLIESTREENWETTHGRLIAHHPSHEELTNIDLSLSLPREMRVLIIHADDLRKDMVYLFHGYGRGRKGSCHPERSEGSVHPRSFSTPHAPLIVLAAVVAGPQSARIARVLVDTGSTLAVLTPDTLRDIGCDLGHPVDVVPFHSFGISAHAPVILVPFYTVLGRTVHDIETVALRMPAVPAHEGVLGLNVLRALGMRIDFRASVLEVDDARPERPRDPRRSSWPPWLSLSPYPRVAVSFRRDDACRRG
jgi:hypothetical protein